MNGMIDPRTQWIIYKHQERDLLLRIELRRRLVDEEQRALAQLWYTQVAKWLLQAALHIVPGKRDVGKVTSAPTCYPACACSCPCR